MFTSGRIVGWVISPSERFFAFISMSNKNFHYVAFVGNPSSLLSLGFCHPYCTFNSVFEITCEKMLCK